MSIFTFDKGETSQPADERQAAEAAPAADGEGLESRIVAALQTVYDPEIPVNIHELGLIYGIDIAEDGRQATVRMTLTAPGCPVAGEMPKFVEHAVRGAVPELEEVAVELVWDPPWTPERMSEAARLELGLF